MWKLVEEQDFYLFFKLGLNVWIRWACLKDVGPRPRLGRVQQQIKMMAGDKCYLSPETTRPLPLDMETLIILIRFVVLCHTKILAMFDVVQNGPSPCRNCLDVQNRQSKSFLFLQFGCLLAKIFTDGRSHKSLKTKPHQTLITLYMSVCSCS